MKALPTLSLHGFITDESLMMSKIYEYFLTTQQSQSVIYEYYIKSYDKIVKDTPTVSRDVINALQENLHGLYSEYFVNVEAIVNLEERDKNDNSVYRLLIEVNCVGNSGNNLSLSKALVVNNGNIADLTEIIDYFKG